MSSSTSPSDPERKNKKKWERSDHDDDDVDVEGGRSGCWDTIRFLTGSCGDADGDGKEEEEEGDSQKDTVKEEEEEEEEDARAKKRFVKNHTYRWFCRDTKLPVLLSMGDKDGQEEDEEEDSAAAAAAAAAVPTYLDVMRQVNLRWKMAGPATRQHYEEIAEYEYETRIKRRRRRSVDGGDERNDRK